MGKNEFGILIYFTEKGGGRQIKKLTKQVILKTKPQGTNAQKY